MKSDKTRQKRNFFLMNSISISQTDAQGPVFHEMLKQMP